MDAAAGALPGAAGSALRQAVPDYGKRLALGQIEILTASQWYAPGGVFDGGRVLQGWQAKLDAARVAGFEGLRVACDTAWLKPEDRQDFANYEDCFDRIVCESPMLALCTYSQEQCGTCEMLQAFANHEAALLEEHGRWEWQPNRARAGGRSRHLPKPASNIGRYSKPRTARRRH